MRTIAVDGQLRMHDSRVLLGTFSLCFRDNQRSLDNSYFGTTFNLDDHEQYSQLEELLVSLYKPNSPEPVFVSGSHSNVARRLEQHIETVTLNARRTSRGHTVIEESPRPIIVHPVQTLLHLLQVSLDHVERDGKPLTLSKDQYRLRYWLRLWETLSTHLQDCYRIGELYRSNEL